MKLGINGTGLVQTASIDAIEKHAQQAAADGFSSYWLAEHPTGGLDAMTVLTVVGRSVKDIELGTAIIPTFPRHPMVLAGQTHTLLNAIGQRFTLGVGLSHETMMAQLGVPFERPMRHLKEYLSILIPLINQGKVQFSGELLSCEAQTFFKPEHHTPIVVAALGPQALKIAGTLADGTTLAWVGPRTVREHIKPRLCEAADAAERSQPRIIATLPICVTDDEDRVRALISKNLKMYSQLPSYKAMFEREGVTEAGELALVGSAAKVQDLLGDVAKSGVTDFAASEFTTNPEEKASTRELLKNNLR
ncbi:MAG: 5,10-methylenetetrahydromethanopterin reductase [Paraglaciecola psychrophila]|jgi:5,10-methylenetetrahydromethanopterin reductase